MRDRLRRYLRPPRGVDVRRVVAFVLLGVAIPRLPFYPLDPPVYPLRLLPGEVFGWLALATALAQDNAGTGIGRPMWRMKCSHEASVIVETLPDGTNLVTCFLYW